jgi:PAS domain S-box-containing protein
LEWLHFAATISFLSECVVMALTSPTLEDLRESPLAAWLWDSARSRIIWANKAGVTAFEATSLFDLIDRSFDPKESGVAQIKELGSNLERAESQRTSLLFPSVGAVVALECRCWVHALADGRQGILVIEEPSTPALTAAPDAVAGSVLSALPLPLLVLDADGSFIHANAAAQNLLSHESYRSLAELIVSEHRAATLLSRLANTSLATSTETVLLQGASRMLRCTLSRNDNALFTLMLEDVTERRALEHNILSQQIAALDAKTYAGPVSEPPPPTSETAFETLGKAIAETMKAQDTPVSETWAEILPVATVEVPVVPDAVRLSLERTGKAILVMRDGNALYATSHAATVLGYATLDLLFNEPDVWSALNESSGDAMLSLKTATGAVVAFECKRGRIPWLSGPADQFVLQASLPVTSIFRAPDIAVAPALAVEAEVVATTSATISHDELKAILDVASDGIITLNADGEILSFSAGAQAIFGQNENSVLQLPLINLLKSESRKVVRDYIAGLTGPGLATVFNDGREVVAETPDGGTVPLFITISRLQSPQSRASLCAVVRDITTWKRNERDLLKAKEEAEAANRQKSDFLARISHELRTPLNAILGFSDVMRSERFGEMRNEKYRGYVQDIFSSGEHLLALINDLLDLSKVEAGKLELNFTAESLGDATEHAVKLLQEEARHARVLVRTAFPAKLPRVVADHRSLRQIMLNLISNGIKYTDAGGQVLVSAAVESDGTLVMRVKDTGIGMTEAQMHDALQPFIRVETAERQRQGTGLGLPLTKALVEANRAKLRLSSMPAQGTIVEVIFPGTRVLAE